MNYPVWDVPVIGGGWIIGGIAIFHVLISHFAVGGGFYLPMAERKALRENRSDWMDLIKSHSKFFLTLTAVFGTVSGVGIWFAIGLVSPEATSSLIHNFVFAWSIEWAFFLVEIAAIIVYYYTWDRISPRLHLAVGWVYAGSAWMSLFVINGILTFMLTPGQEWLSVAGTGQEPTRFFYAFFNPTFLPSLCLRTLITISLAGIWALVTASRIDPYKKPQLKAEVTRWSARWLLPAYVLIPLFFIWYLQMVPASHRALLSLGVSTIGQGVFTQVTRAALVTVMTSATIGAIVYFLAYRNPRDFTFGHACAVLVLALAATASTEQAREMLRKPYVLGEFMYSNGVRITEVEKFDKDGYLARSPWAKPEDRAQWEKVDATLAARTDPAAPPADVLPGELWQAHLRRGQLVMMGECRACHTVDGYRSLATLLKGRNRESIANTLAMLHKPLDEFRKDSPYATYMPPLVGTQNEVDALIDYLDTLVEKPQAQETAMAQAAP